jgi:hypothetical protein
VSLFCFSHSCSIPPNYKAKESKKIQTMSFFITFLVFMASKLLTAIKAKTEAPPNQLEPDVWWDEAEGCICMRLRLDVPAPTVEPSPTPSPKPCPLEPRPVNNSSDEERKRWLEKYQRESRPRLQARHERSMKIKNQEKQKNMWGLSMEFKNQEKQKKMWLHVVKVSLFRF